MPSTINYYVVVKMQTNNGKYKAGENDYIQHQNEQ